MIVPMSIGIHNKLLNYVKELIVAWFSGQYQIDELKRVESEFVDFRTLVSGAKDYVKKFKPKNSMEINNYIDRMETAYFKSLKNEADDFVIKTL